MRTYINNEPIKDKKEDSKLSTEKRKGINGDDIGIKGYKRFLLIIVYK